MEKIKNIKWKDKLLYERIFTVLVIVFAITALTMIAVDIIYDNNRLLSKLSSLFIILELISGCIANFRANKKLYTVLITIELLILILSLIRIFV